MQEEEDGSAANSRSDGGKANGLKGKGNGKQSVMNVRSEKGGKRTFYMARGKRMHRRQIRDQKSLSRGRRRTLESGRLGVGPWTPSVETANANLEVWLSQMINPPRAREWIGATTYSIT